MPSLLEILISFFKLFYRYTFVIHVNRIHHREVVVVVMVVVTGSHCVVGAGLELAAIFLLQIPSAGLQDGTCTLPHPAESCTLETYLNSFLPFILLPSL